MIIRFPLFMITNPLSLLETGVAVSVEMTPGGRTCGQCWCCPFVTEKAVGAVRPARSGVFLLPSSTLRCTDKGQGDLLDLQNDCVCPFP